MEVGNLGIFRYVRVETIEYMYNIRRWVKVYISYRGD